MEIDKIKKERETILIGEIGALLHDIGKFHPYFIKTNSLEHVEGLPHHARDIDKFVKPELLSLFKDKKYETELNNEINTIYDLIKCHHKNNNKGKDNNGNDKCGEKTKILEYLQMCDRKDSADDKGIVRRKQPMDNTIISSPFGYTKESINLKCLQSRFNDLQDNLINLFQKYSSEEINISTFRNFLLAMLETSFSHALGETMIPANDVTLWDHSFSTASLFKTVLTGALCGSYNNNNDLKWRIFTISWNGEEFINKGKKIADIQTRDEIINDIKLKLKMQFEDVIPIGNTIYEDVNEISFTFPDLNKNCDILAEECAQIALKIVNKQSDNELWPIFTLSKPSSSLTIIAEQLMFAAEKRNIPKMNHVIYLQEDNGYHEEQIQIDNNVNIVENKNGGNVNDREDICPVCGIRSKKESSSKCDICQRRAEGRLSEWLNKPEDTIWVDEVADKNNKIALISLNFNLDKWLNGTMIGSIYSQTLEEWRNSKKIKQQKDLNSLIPLTPDKKDIYLLLDEVIKNKDLDNDEVAKILNTFFEELKIDSKDKFNTNIGNIEARLNGYQLTKENLATYLFTMNPSPARIYRVWKETQSFFEFLVDEIKFNTFSNKWNRVKFYITSNDLRSISKLVDNTSYIIKIENLDPQYLLILHIKNGEFYTIETLDKYRFKNNRGEEKVGIDAVKEALKTGFDSLYKEDDIKTNLLDKSIHADDIKEDNKYIPLIEINRSPVSLRMIAPASESVKIIKLITHMYNERFNKVIGKLPLNIKLLVADRKFPLYILLDAEKRMLDDETFEKPVYMNPWWIIDETRYDPFYKFYPVKTTYEHKGYSLDDLLAISKGKIFQLYPGYFDFDILTGTTDRYNIYYENGKRGSEDYKLLTGRPYYLYQISEIAEIWDLLSNLSNTQIDYIEEVLTSKLMEWRYVEDGDKRYIFRKFAEATLKDAFGDKWDKLREETKFFLINSSSNGLLIDTIVLFKHMIKKEIEENE